MKLNGLDLRQIISTLKPDKGLDKNKLLLAFLIFATLAYLDFAFVIRMQSKGVSALDPKIKKLEKDIDGFYREAALVKEFRQKKQVAPAAKEHFLVRKIIRQEDIPLLLQDIMDIANKGGVKIEQIKPSRDPKAKEETVSGIKLLPLTIDLDLYCGYHNLGKFINGIDNSAKFMFVEEARVSSGSSDYFSQNSKLKIKTYVKK